MRRVLAALLFLVFGCTGCELFSRALLSRPPDSDYRAYLLSPAPALANAPFLTDDYRAELAAVPLTCGYGNHVVWHSKYFNYDNCHRRVVGQPKNYSRTLWMIGNSTLQNPELPDSYTIASQLQALVPDWRVEQVTSSGGGVWTMQDILEGEPIKPGDTVILYTGAMDALRLYSDGRSQRTLEPREVPCYHLLYNSDVIYTIRLLCDWQALYIPDSSLTADFLSQHAKQVVVRYSEGLTVARQYVEGRGARFINVLQPYLWSRAIAEAERPVQVRVDTLYPHIVPVLQFVYPLLQPYADLDLTHVLDSVRDTQVVFFDGWHMNHIGIERVARAIWEYIATR